MDYNKRPAGLKSRRSTYIRFKPQTTRFERQQYDANRQRNAHFFTALMIGFGLWLLLASCFPPHH